MSLHYGYGYGSSKPQVNYHQQNSECVTTVTEEISRMTVNQRPACYGGSAGVVGDVQEKVCKEGQLVAIEEKGGGYHGYHGGDAAVHKQHEYRNEAFQEKAHSGYHGGGGAVQKHGRYRQEAFKESADGYGGYHGGAALQKHGYRQEEAFDGACDDGGYPLHHGGGGGAAVNKHGYQHGAYGGTGAGYASRLGGDMQKHGYRKEAYGGHYGGGAKQQQAVPYGGAVTGAVQQHTYQDAYYGEANDTGYGGAYYGGGAMLQKAGYGGGGGAMQTNCRYKQEMYGSNKTGGGYPLHHGGVLAGGTYHHDEAYESESDCEESDDGSDCEEAFHPHGGGAHGYEAYRREEEKHGGSSLGGVRRYESYERRENLGGGHRYESYQTTTHEGYTGGAGYGACAPRKNRFVF